ncbi:ABC transporter C family member 6 [Forsythia ovata]|uniref:ABC transporter C family member 6 n=1 Tax=Forsythia ovata TaxID=205694 RepID=A0ABD1UY77_9LAMI
MKDGKITQDGKYNDILKSGSDFMELVGAHKEALSALDSIEAGAAVVGEDSSTGNAKNFLQKKESPTDQNDKTDNAMGTNGQLIQAEDSFNQKDVLSSKGKWIPKPSYTNLLPLALSISSRELRIGKERLHHFLEKLSDKKRRTEPAIR